MLFLGTTFLGARYVMDPSPTKAKDVKNIYINNGTFDQLFVSKNPDLKAENRFDDCIYCVIFNVIIDRS